MTRARAHIDFETRSLANLPRVGAYIYAMEPSTDILIMGWRINDGPVKIWRPDMPFPQALAEHIAAGGELWAHNAQFERLIWQHVGQKRYGFPAVQPEQWFCTAAAAANMGLPRALGAAAAVLGEGTAQKDAAGHRVMRKLSQPRPDGGWWTRDTAPEDFARLEQYCIADVEAESGLAKRLLALTPHEREIYLLDQRINDRGIAVDLPLVRAMHDIVQAERKRLDAELAKATNGEIKSTAQAQRLVQWCTEHGVPLRNLTPAAIQAALREPLADAVQTALLARQEAARASTAKLQAFLDCTSEDGRCRGLLVYAGAARTRRWAGQLVQPQNLPRGTLPQRDHDMALAMIRRREIDGLRAIYGSALDVVASLLRGCITAAPDNYLIAADYANIEGRALAWLAGEEWKLEAFRAFDRQEGPDLYRVAYSRAMGVPVDKVTKEQRQVGKVIELACGYQGWTGAFQAFAAVYGLQFTEEQAAHLAGAWRKAHPAIVQFWDTLNETALQAVRQPGRTVDARRVQWVCKAGYLWCRLPSGGVLAYRQPRIAANHRGEPAVHFWGTNSRTRKWEEMSGYGGLWAENITQALCRDLLADAMLRLDKAGYRIVLTVHDEIVCEVLRRPGHGSLEEMCDLMAQPPAWADGLPIATDGWVGERYRK